MGFLSGQFRPAAANFSLGSAYPGERERIRQRSWIGVPSAFRRYCLLLTYGRLWIFLQGAFEWTSLNLLKAGRKGRQVRR